MIELTQKESDELNKFVHTSIENLIKGFVAQFPDYLDTCQFNVLLAITQMGVILEVGEDPPETLQKIQRRKHDAQITYNSIFKETSVDQQHTQIQANLRKLFLDYLEYTTKLELQAHIAELYSQFRFFFGDNKDIISFLLTSLDDIKNKVIMRVAFDIDLPKTTKKKGSNKGFKVKTLQRK